MSLFKSTVKSDIPQIQTETEKEIFWGDESGGSQCFPNNMSSIYSRSSCSYLPPEERSLKAFIKDVRGAKERVWIIDPYFFIPEDKSPENVDSHITSILSWFPENYEASDTRILTKTHQEINKDLLDLFQIKANEINASRAYRPQQCLIQKCSIQICTHLDQKLIHDRFAIIDNILWHFGATVGGFHTGINAASRGWNAETTNAISFFKMIWDEMKEDKK